MASFFFQTLLLKKEWLPYCQALKNKIEDSCEEL
jgi:hypothetical protein